MRLMLGLVPFFVFSLLVRLSDDLALWVAFATAFTLGMRSFLETRVLKTLDAGCTALFGILALYKGFIQPSLSWGMVMLAADGGLLAIMIGSLIAHEPFTLQYSREQVSPDTWNMPAFLRANHITTVVWVGALAIMTVSDTITLLTAQSFLTGVVSLAVLAGAITYAFRYPVTDSRLGRGAAD